MKEQKTKSQQAQEYAEKKIESEYGISREDFIEAGCRFGYNDVVQAYSDGYTACEQSMTDSEAEHTKDEFVARMQGKFTEQDLADAKQRTKSCMASIPQLELPKQIETQIDEAMAGIKAEARRQFGDFGAPNADVAIPIYRQMMRLGALLALSAEDSEAEQTDGEAAVIQGWVAIDEAYGEAFLHEKKPILKSQPIADTGDYNCVWHSDSKTYLLDAGLFPDMDCESEPREVEITIKPKKR